MECQGQYQGYVFCLPMCIFRITCRKDIGWGHRDIYAPPRISQTVHYQYSSSGSLSRGWMASTSLDQSHQTTNFSLHIRISRQQD